MSSQLSNGRLVRFVGRNRVEDGFMLSLVSIVCPFIPFLQLCWYKISTKRSWGDSLFQLFNIGFPIPTLYLERRQLKPVHRHLRFVCISDTHMRHNSLQVPLGDVLVHSGDFTNHGSLEEVREFALWLSVQPHKYKIVVPGNHDMILDTEYYEGYWGDWSPVKESSSEAVQILQAVSGVQVLIDEDAIIEGVRIWGSPWVPQHTAWRTAFNKSPPELEQHWRETLSTGTSIDVLITHSPPKGHGDIDSAGSRMGCDHLLDAVNRVKPSYHVFGHVHSDYGVHRYEEHECIAINASSVCDYYCYTGTRPPISFDVPVISITDELS